MFKNKSIIAIALVAISLAFASCSVVNKERRDFRKHSAPEFVQSAIAAYDVKGTDIFADFSDRENATWVKHKGRSFIFAMNAQTGELVTRNIGITNPTPPQQAFIDFLIAASASKPEGMWVAYYFPNPRTGKQEIKRSWIVMHDGYVFGSGNFIRSKGYGH